MEALYWALAVLVMSGAGFLLGRRQGRARAVLAAPGAKAGVTGVEYGPRLVGGELSGEASRFQIRLEDGTVFGTNDASKAARAINQLRSAEKAHQYFMDGRLVRSG